jgi:hypothetical protein
MNNEPVAWMSPDGKVSDTEGKLFYIPLYTHPVNPKYDLETGEPLIDGYPLFSGLPHPVKDKPHPKCDEACMYLCQMRELTDEEITQVFDECYPNNGDGDVVTLIDFARAILRKAQEK